MRRVFLSTLVYCVCTLVAAASIIPGGLISAALAQPAGMVSAFNGACPAGWTEVSAAQGRAIVGLPSGGTLAGTVGTALTNLQDKTHTHTYTDVVNHTHTVNVTDPGHNHTQNSFAPRIVNSGTAGTVGVQGASTASNASASNSATTATNISSTTGVTAATVNPGGGVATGTTATKATSDVISYIQFRICQKD